MFIRLNPNKEFVDMKKYLMLNWKHIIFVNCNIFTIFAKIKFMTNPFSAVILSAGYSGRMGVPKWSLMFDDKRTFAEKLVCEFENAGAQKIILVLNESGQQQFVETIHDLPENFEIVINDNPDLGRFYSLQKGLELCNPELPVCFTNIDNPFVSSELIQKLTMMIDEADYVSPVFQGKGGHPCLLSSNLIMSILNENAKNLNLKEYLRNFSKKSVEVVDEKILININTEAEYKQIFKK